MSEHNRVFWILVAGLAVVLLGWSYYDHPELMTRTRAFLGDILNDSKTTAAILSAVFAFATLGVQFWVGGRQAKIGSRQANASRISADAAMLTAKSSGNRAIASLRIKWVEELRAVLSEYHSILMTAEEFKEKDLRLLANLGTKLDLMMNLNEADQKDLWEIADQIYNTEDIDQRKALDPKLMVAGRLVLKNEWEKIKRELRGEDPAP